MHANLHIDQENPKGQFILLYARRYISAIWRFRFSALHQIQPIFFKDVAGFLLIQSKPQPSFSMSKACLYIPIPKLDPDSVLDKKLQFPKTRCKDF